MNELLRARVPRRLFKCLSEFAFGTILRSLYESLREDEIGDLGAGPVIRPHSCFWQPVAA